MSPNFTDTLAAFAGPLNPADLGRLEQGWQNYFTTLQIEPAGQVEELIAIMRGRATAGEISLVAPDVCEE